MRRTLYWILPVVVLAIGVVASAQQTAAPAAPAKLDITAEQVMEKAIDAIGGQKAFEGLKSQYMKGKFEFPSMGVTGESEIFQKAPNKQMSVTTVEGFGEIRLGFDGEVAWADNPMAGLTTMEGEALAAIRLQSTFNAELKWKELYPKAELKGKEPVGEREAYVVELTPAEGKPATHYYDAENFLLLRSDVVVPTMSGMNLVQWMFSDYKDVEGRKIPHTVKQNIPEGEIVITLAEVKSNIDIDDARFAKPGPPPAPEAKPEQK